MSRLNEITRKPQLVHYARWDRQVAMRPISCNRFIDLMTEFEGAPKITADHLRIVAELLGEYCLDPSATAEQWLNEASHAEVIELGNLLLQVSDMTITDEKKSE